MNPIPRKTENKMPNLEKHPHDKWTVKSGAASRLGSQASSDLKAVAIELWNMVGNASVKSINGEWSEGRALQEAARFEKRLLTIISQNTEHIRADENDHQPKGL